MSIFRIFPSRKASAMVSPASRRQKFSRRRETQRHESSTNMDPNLAAFREDRGELKRDVASLIEHIRARRRTEFRKPPPKLIGRAGAAPSPTRGEKNRLLCMGAPR